MREKAKDLTNVTSTDYVTYHLLLKQIMKQIISPLFFPTLKKKPPDFILNLLSEKKGGGYWKRARMMTQISDHAYHLVSFSFCRDKDNMHHPQEQAIFWELRHLDMWQSWGLAARGTGRSGTQLWL